MDNNDFESINLSELTDLEIVQRMKICNYEKYKTLVRMHLSFELELNTDEFDLPCHEIVYEDKGKLKKWNRLSKKHKHVAGATTTGCATTAKSAGNSPTEGLTQQIDSGFIFHLEELKEFFLLEKNLKQEGIFRKNGSVSRQNELRLHIQNEKPLDLEAGEYSAHDCATVFKSYLAELTEPLLTDAHYPAHMQIATLCIGLNFSSSTSTSTRPPNPERIKREQRLLNSMQFLLLLLPDDNRRLLRHIIEVLHAVASLEHINKMSADNLATLFAPHLICPRNLPPEALHFISKKMSCVIAYMITKAVEIFEIPAKLSTDIRAYFLERKRKKTMSPEQTLDDSISDISTVNTVYTFVDRERTAAAHTANTTDTELAQLYAHIQSLPESSKKRRLIKQFNKQNGQGTPLQLVIMNRLKNSEATRSAKSFSDSIKKHIFHKGIMSRTPKRTTAPIPVGIETPNFSNTKQPKLRVLFQSPTPSACSSINTTNVTPTATVTSNAVVTNTPYTLKSHPLQKSISSSSLLLNSSQRKKHNFHHTNSNQNNDENDLSSSSCSSSTHSNDGLPQQHQQLRKLGCSASAPVSRQTSTDLPSTNTCKVSALNTSNSSIISSTSVGSSTQHFQLMQSDCCVTPLKLITEVAKNLISTGGGGGTDKKAVVWDEHHLLNINEEDTSCTLLQCGNEFKLRYKSEPNLSRIIKDKLIDIPETVPEQCNLTPIQQSNADVIDGGGGGHVAVGKSLTRRLIKGVSMGNLKFPFSTPETTKRLVRNVSATLKRRHSDEAAAMPSNQTLRNCDTIPTHSNFQHNNYTDLEDLDDDTFEDDPNDHIDTDSDLHDDNIDENESLEIALDAEAVNNSSSCEIPVHAYNQILVQPTGLYRNIDLITSTPALLLGRRSMSPITKSAQRMPKSMQESIMTPRSRKPVMVLTTTLGSSDQNQTIYQTDLSSFREQDEDGSPSGTQPPNLHSEDANSFGSYADLLQRKQKEQKYHVKASPKPNEALSDNFKEYLRSRSVFAESPPVDSSFSSHPDDFGDDDDDDFDEQNSTREIVKLNDSQLSPSLLYCLDGNEPLGENEIKTVGKVVKQTNESSFDYSNEAYATPPSHINIENRLRRRDIAYTHHNPFIALNNARKRAANTDLTKSAHSPSKSSTLSSSSSSDVNKENEELVDDDYLLSKKILISEFPNETSF